MNFEFPTDPRKALEASLTALLLGELPDEQARFLRQTIATDPELAKTFEALKKSIELVRETEAEPAQRPAVEVPAPKLSNQRREELLQRFKEIRPAQFQKPAGRRVPWFLPVAAAAALMMILASLLLGRFSKPLSFAQLKNTDSEELFARRPHQPSNKIADNLAPRKRVLMSGGWDNRGDVKGLYSQPPPPSSSPAQVHSAPAVSVAPPIESGIILPVEGKPESLTLSTGQAEEGKRDSTFTTFGVIGGEVRQQANPPGSVTQHSLSGGGGGVGGANVVHAPELPVLGDVPTAGRLFRNGGTPNNATTSSFSPDGIKLGYVNTDAFAAQEQLGRTDNVWALAASPVPYFAGPAGKEVTANSKDEAKFPVSNFEELKKSADLSASYYGGGTFGGYSTVQALVPQPGQKIEDITIQGVGDVPVIADRGAKDKEKPTLQRASGIVLPWVKAEAEKVPDLNTPHKQVLTIAKLDAARQNPSTEQLNERLLATKSRVESEKNAGGIRSKSLGLELRDGRGPEQDDVAAVKKQTDIPEPQPEIQTRDNPFSTFSLNVSDVSFKLAAASLEKGVLPEPAGIRSEEFINAFDYRDPEPPVGVPVAFVWERAGSPFAQNRDLLRFSIKTAAAGRQTGRPLNVVLLLDNSGSMERADRVSIIHEALRVLAVQLGAQDTFSVVTFARTARLWVDGIPGDQAGRVADELSNLTPEGGTNLEEAMNLAYQTALRHYAANGINRVVLLTDGAANLGTTDPEALKKKVETNREQGIALDCFGIGWEGYNDDLLEVLTRNGDGRYGFLNTPEEAASEFAGQLAGALRVAAADVKVQVEFNTNRVTSYRQIGYARHQLAKDQFRDNSVNAAAIGAAESGNALYVVETNPQGEGPLAIVRVRYRIPATAEYREQEWTVPFTGVAAPLEQASPAIRLAATTAVFSEWLASSPYATDVTPDRLLSFLSGVASVYGADPRPQKIEWMIRQAKALSGK
jgi:Mg-chelatase subunit ChlD